MHNGLLCMHAHAGMHSIKFDTGSGINNYAFELSHQRHGLSPCGGGLHILTDLFLLHVPSHNIYADVSVGEKAL